MIVPMKKIFILTQAKDATAAVKSLRQLGVMHIEHQKQPKGEDINSLHEDLVVIDKAINILRLPEFYEGHGIKSAKALKDWRPAARHLVDARSRYDQLCDYSASLKQKIGNWEAWGDFDPAKIASLAAKNINIKLCQVPSKELSGLGKGFIVKVISTVRGMANCVVISDKKINIPYKELAVPAMGLKAMKERLSENSEAIEKIKSRIWEYACYYGGFISIKKAFEKELEFHEAMRGMGQSKEIAYLKGYVPFDSVNGLLGRARGEKWGVFITDPSGDDNVPTLVRNPRWVSIISPVFKLIEVIPGYGELDISLWFLLFLSVFFGMLVGDAAYGAIFFSLTLFSQFKWGKKVPNKSVFFLLYILSSCAFVWGLLTGTFFGQGWLPGWVKPCLPALRDDKNVQAFCFLLGAIHLSIAHLWRAVTKAPSSKALADIGWIIILWGSFFLAKTLVLGFNFPPYGKWFFISGPVLVVLFTDPQKNILKGIGSGLANFLLSVVNSFTDVVSYIRLFAVGLATVAVADSFNKMAMDIGFKGILPSLLTALVLLIGHSLNIVLGPMSVLVHGVRLNVLEFCSHIDIKWSGFNYKPLKEGE